jgi:hypothetical protein
MQAATTRRYELLYCLDRVFPENCFTTIVTLLQAYTTASTEIDCWPKFHYAFLV